MITPSFWQQEEKTMRVKYKGMALAIITAALLTACVGPHHSHGDQKHDGKSHTGKDYHGDQKDRRP
jgi:hypothetical protein